MPGRRGPAPMTRLAGVVDPVPDVGERVWRPSGRPRRAGRWIILSVSVLLSVPVAGWIYQSIGAAVDRRDHPPPGRLVDMGGFRLHRNAQGEEREGPTVVLEAGLGGTS